MHHYSLVIFGYVLVKVFQKRYQILFLLVTSLLMVFVHAVIFALVLFKVYFKLFNFILFRFGIYF